MKAIVFAYHDMGIAGLDALLQAGFAVAGVFSHEDAPEENCWFGSVVDWCGQKGIPVFCPENVNTDEWKRRIAAFAPDVIFSFYYRHLIAQDLLNLAPAGAYNLHGSLLPAYRGRAPVNWVLVRGEERTGVTLHHMVKRADAGDIVGQRVVPIDFEDTALTLYGKMCEASRLLLAEFLPLIKTGRAPRTPQDEAAATTVGRRRPEDGRIDWQWPASRIYNLIRAVTDPYPGAFALLPAGEKLFIWRALPAESPGTSRPAGTVAVEDDRVWVTAGEGRLRLLEIGLASRRMQGEALLGYFKNKEGMILL
jgi:methionyl-tRNA formyltransferase